MTSTKVDRRQQYCSNDWTDRPFVHNWSRVVWHVVGGKSVLSFWNSGGEGFSEFVILFFILFNNDTTHNNHNHQNWSTGRWESTTFKLIVEEASVAFLL